MRLDLKNSRTPSQKVPVFELLAPKGFGLEARGQTIKWMKQYLLKGILKQCFSCHCNLYVLWHGQLLKYKNVLSQLSPLKWPIKKPKG